MLPILLALVGTLIAQMRIVARHPLLGRGIAGAILLAIVGVLATQHRLYLSGDVPLPLIAWMPAFVAVVAMGILAVPVLSSRRSS